MKSSLVWTKTRDGEHNDKPRYEYHATSEDRTYHIVWAYDRGGTFGYTATRPNVADGCTEYLGPHERAPYSITWCRTLKFCKEQCELIERRYWGKERHILVPNIAGAFKDFDDWVNRATRSLANKTCETSGCTMPVPAMCVDTKGRRCYQGGDFMRARDEGTFPVSYFWDCKPETIHGK